MNNTSGRNDAVNCKATTTEQKKSKKQQLNAKQSRTTSTNKNPYEHQSKKKQHSTNTHDGDSKSLARRSSSSSSQRQRRSWGLTQILMGVIAMCSLLNTLFCITYVNSDGSGALRHYTDTAVHQAMKTFVRLRRTNATLSTTTQDGTAGGEGASNATRTQEKMNSTTSQHLEEGDAAEGAPETEPPVNMTYCKAYGGPKDEDYEEMIYWRDIPSDGRYVSPFVRSRTEQEQGQQQGQKKKNKKQARRTTTRKKYYLSFELDLGAFNNMRMAMETVLALAVVMGRTLVLPPEQRIYQMEKEGGEESSNQNQKRRFGFSDFFPLEELWEKTDGRRGLLDIISTEEFLRREYMTGRLRDRNTGKATFPPGNRTNWDGANREEILPLKEWLRTKAAHAPLWVPEKCMATFPAYGGAQGDSVQVLRAIREQIVKDGLPPQDVWRPIEHPIPVDASPMMARMKESIAGERDLCIYDENMQKEPVLHFMADKTREVRMLTHFYAFLFFEDWREDLWMKRFIRDRVRYRDEVQCAAGRIVSALREYAKSKARKNGGDGDRDDSSSARGGEFDAFHVRRGDFLLFDEQSRVSAEQMYENTRDVLRPGSLIYIATDEGNKTFFDPLRERYDIKFLDDFTSLLSGVNTNFYGMIDQLVAARGRNFFGCWKSTFTGYINRIRGYHSTKEKLPGYEKGLLPTSYYYTSKDYRNAMHKYYPQSQPFFIREFPTSWRGLDEGIGILPSTWKKES